MAKNGSGSAWAVTGLDELQLPVPPDWKPAFKNEAG